MQANKLGEILTKQGLIRPDQLKSSLDHAQKNKMKLGSAIVAIGL